MNTRFLNTEYKEDGSKKYPRFPEEKDYLTEIVYNAGFLSRYADLAFKKLAGSKLGDLITISNNLHNVAHYGTKYGTRNPDLKKK